MHRLSLLPVTFAVCRLPADAPVPAWAWTEPFCAVTRAAAELSIVCAGDAVPADVTAERGWRALKVAGPLDFSLVGILARIAEPLAAAGIPIFALSTYDTDYVLVKQERLAAAITALRAAGWDVNHEDHATCNLYTPPKGV